MVQERNHLFTTEVFTKTQLYMANQNITSKTSEIRIASHTFPEKEYHSKIQHFNQSPDQFSVYPVIVDEEHQNSFKRIGNILHDVLVMFAYNFTRDERLQQVYQLDHEINEIMKMTEGIPYEIGMYKLNYVVDGHGQPRISEINCQFPTKNWMLSAHLSEAVAALSSSEDLGYSSIQGLGDYLNALENLFELDEVLYIVRKDKTSSDETLVKELKSKGLNAVYVEPKDFTIEDGALKVGKTAARQFLLELNAEELKLFDRDVLQVIVQSGRCLNDVRSIILVHNKKLMAGLFNAAMMSRYINSEDFEFLKSYLIPSFVLNGQQDIDYLNNSQDNWKLKKSAASEGEGVHIRSNYSPEDWNQLLTEKWQDFLVQPLILQKEFSLKSNDKETPVNLIGMELYFNAKSYGAGFFRASKDLNMELYKDSFILPAVVKKSN